MLMSLSTLEGPLPIHILVGWVIAYFIILILSAHMTMKAIQWAIGYKKERKE